MNNTLPDSAMDSGRPVIEQLHHNPTKQQDQFVVAYLTSLEKPLAVLSHALYLAQMLHKGLILIHISDEKYTQLTPADVEPRLQQLRESLPADADVSYIALKGNTKEIITQLPVLLGAVALVCHVDAHARRRQPQHPKELLKNFATCKVAYLTVQEPIPKPQGLKNIAFTVNVKRQSKEKYIWSSYFARFNDSHIHALHYHYKDEILRRKWSDNMRFLQKLYDALNITYQSHEISDRSPLEDVNALRYCAKEKYDLLISLTTDERDALELFIGTSERHIIVNPYHIPVLFLNPREDLYVICD